MVEYSSPNTNKPLHLGHIRNNLLGFSVAQILKEAGYNVVKTQIINDRGIHICKSMLAWEKFGNGETPETTGLKGDKLVGNYYVEFDKNYKSQISELKEQGLDEETAKKQAPIILEAQKMLLDWEQNKPEVRELWEKMNSWVYAGFNETYKRLGVDFDQVQYESNTYILGKDIIEEGLAKGVFFKKKIILFGLI
jgi:arginyl-tRNA synthetase